MLGRTKRSSPMARRFPLEFPRSVTVLITVGGLVIAACGGGSSPSTSPTDPGASRTGSPSASATPAAQDPETFDYEGALLTLAEVQGVLLTEGIKPDLDESVDGFTLKAACGVDAASVYSVAGHLVQYQEAETRYIVNFSVRGFAGDEAATAFATQTENVTGCRGEFLEKDTRAKPVGASEENGVLRFEFVLKGTRIGVIDHWMQSGPLVLQTRFVVNEATSAVPDSLWDQLRDAAVEKFAAATSTT
jgi:hypothetical protein